MSLMKLRRAGILLLALHLGSAGCVAAQEREQSASDPNEPQRLAMVRLIRDYGVRDPATLAAMRSVLRHEFVPEGYRRRAYGDHPLPIGYGQTISQPYIVAYMTETLDPEPGMNVLEVGTGSGYQAAVLAEIGCQVYTVEIFEVLATSARQRLERLGYTNVTVRHADGHYGWSEAAPFDVIIVTAAAGYIPPALVEQLKPGGRMVIPVGSVYGVQNLILVEKDASGDVRTHNLLPVRFVPMLKGLR
ncbi:MAG: protein-L-isoaspartate(D-aspartate) O-methyltransferase [Gemmatimonadota bacterium]|nr:MAG: protein-L-isoaspartate(D-aspartate) O-methyltransferase [Gemmatimonadota bacterium]